MTELQLYGTDGIFHNIIKQSAIMNGRYALLERGGTDLNLNNILSGLDAPKYQFPLTACVCPTSSLDGSIKPGLREDFYFMLFFLTTTKYTGDNKIKSPDPLTNTSMHKISYDWQDMKTVALNFMNALEKVQKKISSQFIVNSGKRKITRITDVQNQSLSGVMISFESGLTTDCEYTDITADKIAMIQLPTTIHQPHFH